MKGLAEGKKAFIQRTEEGKWRVATLFFIIEGFMACGADVANCIIDVILSADQKEEVVGNLDPRIDLTKENGIDGKAVKDLRPIPLRREGGADALEVVGVFLVDQGVDDLSFFNRGVIFPQPNVGVGVFTMDAYVH